ncbi:ATP synthase subunit I [Christiangramia fulva]|uniref:ATP synthase subunit I n=1 Tax=Christiangramia fulva TaxID=2126553 RepID=A0A2R3Z2F4_9FLAO|nr:ATP synthase subunit I [Christiangramia fulva]AVR44436.1 ATP synthase subunit I [Christiangramia fulva]
MNNSFLIIVFLVGFALGVFFFGGLWYSVKKAVVSTKPLLWTFGSFFIRMSLTVLTFYFAGGEDWRRFLAVLIGFMAGRFTVIHITKTIDARHAEQKTEI